MFFLAARNAAKPSGSNITSATIIPTRDCGAPSLITSVSITGANVLASNTTATKHTNSKRVLMIAVVLPGWPA